MLNSLNISRLGEQNMRDAVILFTLVTAKKRTLFK